MGTPSRDVTVTTATSDEVFCSSSSSWRSSSLSVAASMMLARSVTRPAGFGRVCATAEVAQSSVTNKDVAACIGPRLWVVAGRYLTRIHYNVTDQDSTSWCAIRSFHMHRSTRFTLCVGSATLAAFVLSLTALSGQGQPPAPPAGTPPKPLVPVAASSVAANPDPYVGEYVTLTGAVEANLSKTSFSVDQDKTKATGKDVLVLAPSLQKQADANGYVTVIGQLIKFDPAEVEKNLKGYTIDLSPADREKFKGKPEVLARSEE